MSVDIEQTLGRELREVADSIQVPAMPRLSEARRPGRRLPVLVAAAVVLITAGTAAVVAMQQDRDIQPAQPSPSPVPSPTPTPTEATEPIPRGAPTLAHVVDGRLVVDGTEVPGRWWSTRPAGEAWVAVREDYTWWWGRGPEVHELPQGENVIPKISPDGRYVAVARVEDGEGILTVVDTETGRTVAGTPTDLGPVRPAEGAYVVAVTDDGKVVVRRGGSFTVWTRDLVASTLSGEMVFDATSAGVVAGDVEGGPTYLAQLSEKGDLTRVGDLPEHDDLAVSRDGSWVAWTPAGTTAGEVTSIPSLELRALDGSQEGTLLAPEGWFFKVRTYAWEDDSYLLSTVTDDQGRERMARCGAQQGRCVLARTH